VSLMNSGLNPIEKEVVQELANCPDVQHLPLSEVVLVAIIAIGIYRKKLSDERTKQVQAGGFEMGV